MNEAIKSVYLIAGAMYAAGKTAETMDKNSITTNSVYGDVALYGTVGFAIGMLAPVTAPVGLGLAAYDIYKNREAIANRASELFAKVKAKLTHKHKTKNKQPLAPIQVHAVVMRKTKRNGVAHAH